MHLAERRCLFAIGRLEQIVARGFEELVQLRADAVPAIHQQNGAGLSRARRRFGQKRILVYARQKEFDPGALGNGARGEIAAVLDRDGMRHRQSQAILTAAGGIEQAVRIGLGGGVGQAEDRETGQRAVLRGLRAAGLNQQAAVDPG